MPYPNSEAYHILLFLYLHPDRPHTAREIANATGVLPNNVHHRLRYYRGKSLISVKVHHIRMNTFVYSIHPSQRNYVKQKLEKAGATFDES